MKHFWPCVGKVNISLIGGSFFQCLVKNTKILYFCSNFTFLYFFQKKNNLTQKKLLPLKAILTLQTWGQKCFVSESEPFEMIWFGSPFNHQNWNFWPFAIKLKGLFKILFFSNLPQQSPFGHVPNLQRQHDDVLSKVQEECPLRFRHFEFHLKVLCLQSFWGPLPFLQAWLVSKRVICIQV